MSHNASLTMDQMISKLNDFKNFKSNDEIRKAINELRSEFVKQIDDYIIFIDQFNAKLEDPSLVSNLEAQTGNKLEPRVNLDQLDEVPIKLQKETKRDATEYQTTLSR